MPREKKLLRLKAWGLHVRGDLTYLEIAPHVGLAHLDRYSRSASVRAFIWDGWCLVGYAKLRRWAPHRHRALKQLRGARLKTHPAEPAQPPPSPLERLLDKMTALGQEARALGYIEIDQGLRNMKAAVIYAEREKAAKAQ
jgi:hypothetical protein